MREDVEKSAVLIAWLRELLRGPVRPSGDYFDRLGETVASSAPVRVSCS